ncbi:MAG: bifunctional riboflavin kinase/FAD synthetase [Odoribacteraceae bacterium]|jgi:riboflavin kinase/FMN adenylyltransferase|nr:bifunctional riboflavin kinase/FAD synthetase [Odoribacteraceae bacterium]
MITHHGIKKSAIHRPVVTIGSFDGVHRGHHALLETLLAVTRELDGQSVVITFDPHPREILYPMERKPGILSTLAEKTALLEQRGVDRLVILPFTRETGQVEYDAFVKHLLVDTVGIQALVVGHDHRLGRGRAGNHENLRRLADEHAFILARQPLVETLGAGVSSTRIRDALLTGNVHLANELLGYRYPLTGTVVPGEHVGRQIGFPTANLRLDDDRKLLPAPGVYAIEATAAGELYRGMLNVGTRPTVSTAGRLSIEAHLFDFDRDIYGDAITLHLLDRVRGERKFENVNELKKQLLRDKHSVLARETPGIAGEAL